MWLILQITTGVPPPPPFDSRCASLTRTARFAYGKPPFWENALSKRSAGRRLDVAHRRATCKTPYFPAASNRVPPFPPAPKPLREMRPEFWMLTWPQDRNPPLSVGTSRFSNFGLALDFRLSLGLGRRATPEPADHTDCRHADYTAPQPSRLTGPWMIRFKQFAIGVRRRRRDDRSWACPSLRSGNPTADVTERL